MKPGKVREMKLAADAIESWLDKADEFAQAWVDELRLKVTVDEEGDTGSLAQGVVKEIQRQLNLHEDFGGGGS